MDFRHIWKFLKDEKEFFDTFKQYLDVPIDYNNSIYFVGLEWMADPMNLLLMLFRAKFTTMKPTQDTEYVRIKKVLDSRKLEPPFKKKEYDKYMQDFYTNQAVLYVMESSLGAKDNEFIIPSKKVANEKFKDSSQAIESIFESLYIYEGKAARYYVDIYDTITGFDVFLESGPIHVRVSGTNASCFNEENTRKIKIDDDIEIYSIDTNIQNVAEKNNSIFVDTEAEFSLNNIINKFSSFKINSNNEYFISDVAKWITSNMKTGSIVSIKNRSLSEYISNSIISLSINKTPNSLRKMVDLSKLSSHLTKVERTSILEQISFDLSQDLLDMIVPYMEKEDKDVVRKISEMLDKSHIELTSKIIRLGKETGTIRAYNKIFNYYFDLSMSLSGISNSLIPELGGMRKIINLLSISSDDVPSNVTNLEVFIGSILLKVIHIEFSSLPIFNDFLKSGIHVIKDEVSINYTGGVYGNGGNNSVDGWCFEKSNMNISIPVKRPTKIDAIKSVELLKKSLSKFIKTSNKDVEFSALMMVSLMLVPLMRKGDGPSISFVADDDILIDSFSEYIFNGIFRYAEPINTDSGYVIENMINKRGNPIVCKYSGAVTKSIDAAVKLKSSSEVISRFRSTEELTYRTNDGSIILLSRKKVSIKDTVVFNIPIYELSTGEFMIDRKSDESGVLASYFANSRNKIRVVEEKLLDDLRKRVKKGYKVKNHSYYHFFFQLLPSMVALEFLLGEDAWAFHDDIVVYKFGEENALNVKTARNIVLSSMAGKYSISELLNDEIRKSELASTYEVFFDIFMIDKIYHMAYLEKENSDLYVVAFSIKELFKKIGGDFEMTIDEFRNHIIEDSSYIKYDNACRNYRLGSNKEITITNAFFAKKDIEKSDFAAIKINKNDI